MKYEEKFLISTVSFRVKKIFYDFVHDYLRNYFGCKYSFIARTIFEVGCLEVIHEVIKLSERKWDNIHELDFSEFTDLVTRSKRVIDVINADSGDCKNSFQKILLIFDELAKFYFTNFEIKFTEEQCYYVSASFSREMRSVRRKVLERLWVELEKIIVEYWGIKKFIDELEFLFLDVNDNIKDRYTTVLINRLKGKGKYIVECDIDNLFWKIITIAILIRICLDLSKSKIVYKIKHLKNETDLKKEFTKVLDNIIASN